MACPHCNNLAYIHSTSSDIHRLRTISKSDLSSSADLGCTSCRFIFEGTTCVVGPNFKRIEIEQFPVRKHGDETHNYPLVVHAVLKERHLVEVEFYADDGKYRQKVARWSGAEKRVQNESTIDGLSFPYRRTGRPILRRKRACYRRGIGCDNAWTPTPTALRVRMARPSYRHE
jgi:hypothetical protein